MLRTGLTGGICTGKSTVGRMFAASSCHFIDSDTIAHSLFEPGEPVYHDVVKAFGAGILTPDQRIDRKALGAIVFHDQARRLELNSLVHPEIIRRQKKWMDDVEVADPGAVAMVEAALMIEAGTYKRYDKIIVVFCSPQDQLRRLQSRSNLPEAEALARIESQMPLDQKVKYADYVIDTSESLEATRQQVDDVGSRLREQAGSRHL